MAKTKRLVDMNGKRRLDRRRASEDPKSAMIVGAVVRRPICIGFAK
jgi:hypothetical protein